MTYTEDFKCILAKQDNVVNANLFILRNSNVTVKSPGGWTPMG